jgi:hypothetical protein
MSMNRPPDCGVNAAMAVFEMALFGCWLGFEFVFGKPSLSS